MKKKQKTSDFGKGFVYNLILFAKHFEKAHQFLKDWRELRKKNPKLFRDENALAIWFNGASDHFYYLEVPKKFQTVSQYKL